MPTYSIAQAKDNLPKLVDQAIAGDEVTITRHGKVVAEVRAKEAREGKRPSPELLRRIFKNADRRPLSGESAVETLRRMRDGERD
jgi:antitoxin (DNA-binding transcriptional repressor) of toxin-antitoxin stability system